MTPTARLIFHRPQVSHKRDLTAQLLWLLVAILATLLIDRIDDAAHWREEARALHIELARERAFNAALDLPPVAIVLEARTAGDARLRMAEIAGGLDLLRYELRGAK